MNLANIPRFDVELGVARKGTARWIVIQSTQYAKLRVALVDTGPGYIGSHWRDFDSDRDCVVVSVGEQGQAGNTGRRGLSKQLGRDGFWHEFLSTSSGGAYVPGSEIVVPPTIVLTRPFRIITKGMSKRTSQRDNGMSQTLLLCEIPPLIDVAELGYVVGQAVTSQAWSKLMSKVVSKTAIGSASYVDDFAGEYRGRQVSNMLATFNTQSEQSKLIVLPSTPPPSFFANVCGGTTSTLMKFMQ